MEIQKWNLKKEFDDIDDSELIDLLHINNHIIKIVKLKGDYKMHKHENGAKVFMVIEGTLFIDFEDHSIQVNKGEFVKIQQGVAHKPFSPDGVSLLFFEQK